MKKKPKEGGDSLNASFKDTSAAGFGKVGGAGAGERRGSISGPGDDGNPVDDKLKAVLDAHATGKKDMVEARGLFLEALENTGATVDPNVSTIGDLAGLILHLYGEQMVKVEEAMEAKAAAEGDRDNLSQYLDDLQSQRDNAVQKMEDAVRTKRLLEDRLMHGDEIANAEKRKVEIALATANSELVHANRSSRARRKTWRNHGRMC